MNSKFQRIGLCMWFDDQAEAAVEFYASTFKGSRVVSTTRVTKEVAAQARRPEGSILTITFELEGRQFTALNGGPIFKFNEAMSIVVTCDSQEEVDRYWNALGAGGDPKAQQCGWLKDKFGVSWQIVPARLFELLTDADADAPDEEDRRGGSRESRRVKHTPSMRRSRE
jgi:predicted 3-demethylubiquinone-9 3-methyltransferase (glyoxalase superfamily)